MKGQTACQRSQLTMGGKFDLELALKEAVRGHVDRIGWPYSRLETRPLRDGLLHNFYKLHHVELADEPDSRAVLELMGYFWVKTILDVVYGQKLADWFDENKIEIECGPRFPMLSRLVKREILPDPVFVTTLEQGPASYPLLRWPLRLLKQRFITRPLVRAAPSTLWADPSQPVAVASGGLIDKHAELTATRPALIEMSNWFSQIGDETAVEPSGLASRVMEIVEVQVAEYGLELTKRNRDWLRVNIAKSANLVDRHAAKLKSMENIPKWLWIGSSSSFWPRLLANEVIRRGGEVAGHDHGIGSGIRAELDAHLIVKNCCTEFITMTDSQATQIQNSYKADGFLGDRHPKAISISQFAKRYKSESGQNKNVASSVGAHQGNGNRVMLLPLVLAGEITTPSPYPDDFWVVDLNRRILSDLNDMGFDVLIKPHPEFESGYLRSFEDEFGAKVVDELFEECTDLADVFLFTRPTTSAFGWAIAQELPAALIDFGFYRWRSGVRRQLKKNVQFVPGSLNDGKFMDYDKSKLFESLSILTRRDRL
jgi:hypothetical protein